MFLFSCWVVGDYFNHNITSTVSDSNQSVNQTQTYLNQMVNEANNNN